MQQYVPCDFANIPPHPLIYASLEPCRSPSFARRMDLHRPRATHTVGRGPMNDFVLDEEQSGQIDWTHCTLLLEEDGSIRLVENSTTNGIWINNRLLSPGESCTLEDGDSIRLGKCVLWHSKTHELAPHGHVRGNCFCYTFHSFVSRNPPGLSASDKQLREQLTDLERTRADIIEERARLDKKLKELDRESQQIIQSLPDIPPTKPANTLTRAQLRYERLASCVRSGYPDFFPNDVRDFRPQPWLPPDVGPDSDGLDLSLYEIYRSFGALPVKRPPPLPKDHTVNLFTRAMHHDDAPSWNDPDVVWGELQALDLSTPLRVPPSIVFWSVEYSLPVYMHPDFHEASRKGPYAHPYASSEYVFSDESAALNRIQLGLPPLKDPYPLRPTDALSYRTKEYRTVPDEKELANWVALLHGGHHSPRAASLEPPTPNIKTPPVDSVASTSSKRPRVSDVDLLSDGHPTLEGTASPTSPTLHSDYGIGVPVDATLERTPSPTPADAPACPSSIEPSTDANPDSCHPVASRPAKRRKTSHSSTPSPAAASSTSIAPPEEARGILRTSPESLSTAAEHTAVVSGSPSVEPKPVGTTTEPESADVEPTHAEAPDSRAVALEDRTLASPSPSHKASSSAES